MSQTDYQIIIELIVYLYIFINLFKLFCHIVIRELKVFVKRAYDRRVWSRLKG